MNKLRFMEEVVEAATKEMGPERCPSLPVYSRGRGRWLRPERPRAPNRRKLGFEV